MEFLASLPTYDEDTATKLVWDRLSDILNGTEGICYYKHPIISSTSNSVPELTILARGYQPLAIKCLDSTIDEIADIQKIVQDLDDYIIGIEYRFDKERELRRVFKPIGVLALPQISKVEFDKKARVEGIKFIWSNLDVRDILTENDRTRSDERFWKLSKSVFQGVSPLNKGTLDQPNKSSIMGEAIGLLEKDIALLDTDQHKVAIQIAPGPQQVRGLAGTGKTVVLAMKAANIHLRFPDKKILFTFNTQSLYNQAKSLISKFYRINSDSDPDWDKLHILHAWGGQGKQGVYSELCRRHGIRPLTLSEARQMGSIDPLAICCKDILRRIKIDPYYDFILMDEAQDFPKDFFRLLYELCIPTKGAHRDEPDRRICWAYDELQSLSAVNVPGPTELFGLDEQGLPRVSFDDTDYPGGIAKDFALHRSYRCPREVLMLAHGIGLGIHAQRGCVQMLSSVSSWESIGYKVEAGNLEEGQETIICRPRENSPNRLSEIYSGQKAIVEIKAFNHIDDELTWIAESIKSDIQEDNVNPEQIVVICLKKMAKDMLGKLQSELLKNDVKSVIPGFVHAASDFAEQGRVTLSSVHRAKGNEAPVVYIFAFDNLYQYVEEIEMRNRAFTSISRSKGWVRVTGSGKEMQILQREIDLIRKDIPCLKFMFPDMDKIRQLDMASETLRRKYEVKTGREALKNLTNIDKDALASLDKSDLKKLIETLNGMITDEN
jgi:superfamily I DNA and RNA helicase